MLGASLGNTRSGEEFDSLVYRYRKKNIARDQETIRFVIGALGRYTYFPMPAAEAKQPDNEISDDAAISRLRLIQDGLDYSQEHRTSASTDSGGPARIGGGDVRTYLRGALQRRFH
jgi:hypothetical protein